jgi:ureidoglycolate lyase
MAAAAVAMVRERKVQEAEKLIRTICLEVRPLTRESFAPYGEILSARGGVEVDLGGGTPSFAMQTVEAREMQFDFLGRHRQTEQLFTPVGGQRSVVVVATSDPANDDVPDVRKMAAFLVDGTCAFKLHRGIWHTSAFPLGESAMFLVVDREGTLEEDWDLRDLKTSLGVVVEIRP